VRDSTQCCLESDNGGEATAEEPGPDSERREPNRERPEPDRARKKFHPNVGDPTAKLTTPTECVAATAKEGHDPDMQGSRPAQKRRGSGLIPKKMWVKRS